MLSISVEDLRVLKDSECLNFSETVPGGLCQSMQGTVVRIKMNDVPSNRTITISYFFQNRALCCQIAHFLVVPEVYESRFGGIAFSYWPLQFGLSTDTLF